MSTSSMHLERGFSLPVAGGEKHLKVEDVQEAYIEQRDRLLAAIDASQGILGSLREFNKNEWLIRYPTLQEDGNNDGFSSKKSRRSIRRSLCFADDLCSQTDVICTPNHGGLTSIVKLAAIADNQDGSGESGPSENVSPEENELADDIGCLGSSKFGDFSILRLDLKLGPHGSSTSPAALVSQLEKTSIANLLDEQIASAIQHMDKLRLRVTDTSSKVLVTGDLNSGKSTFVNALLRREVMPVDQQPCTTAFCEVHDASENNGVEEVHVIKEGVCYSLSDESTFTRVSLVDLESIVADNEGPHPVLKIYLADSRAPSESLLNNGVVDISLIDAPGLNRDSLKTTAVFARQEEIDVVVFVLSAENHLTLSSREFLSATSREKAYVFVVVNKYEQIRNKEKCRRHVLEQIKELSPQTHKDASDLVHFVDSAAALRPYTANPAFDDLESSLRSFVLAKRSKSKLQPAATFLFNLLSDIDFLVGANAIVSQSDMDRAKDDLMRSKPTWEKMKNSRDTLEDMLEAAEEEGAANTSERTKAILTTSLERVGRGEAGVDNAVSLPTYRGLFGVWDYAHEVRRVLLQSLDAAVKLAEDEARVVTKAGVADIGQLGERYLPQGVERSRRVFVPEAMFSVRPGKKGGLNPRHSATASVVVAGGAYNLGIGLAQRSDMRETAFCDIFDFNHDLAVHFGGDKTEDGYSESNHTALSVLSVGVSALTLVGGNIVNVRGLIDGAVRLAELFASESARKWVAPVVGAFALGATAYFIFELPNSIPRTIGRRIRASLLRVDGSSTEQEMFLNAHAGRVSHETRKVLRLASWDLRERFRIAMEERGREVRQAEELGKKAQMAVEYLREVERKTSDIRKQAGLVSGR